MAHNVLSLSRYESVGREFESLSAYQRRIIRITFADSDYFYTFQRTRTINCGANEHHRRRLDGAAPQSAQSADVNESLSAFRYAIADHSVNVPATFVCKQTPRRLRRQHPLCKGSLYEVSNNKSLSALQDIEEDSRMGILFLISQI